MKLAMAGMPSALPASTGASSMMSSNEMSAGLCSAPRVRPSPSDCVLLEPQGVFAPGWMIEVDEADLRQLIAEAAYGGIDGA